MTNSDPDPSDVERSRAAAMLGRLGGPKGGKARAAALTPERRREIAMMGVKARLAKAKLKKPE